MSKISSAELISPAQSIWDTETKFNEAIERMNEHLNRIGDELAALKCPKVHRLTVNLCGLSKEYIENRLQLCEVAPKSKMASDYLYIIHIEDKEKSRELCKQLKEDAHKEERRKAKVGYSRVNCRNDNDTSATLYVGRSKNLKSRLRQHLGAESLKPYALHMELWATCNDLEVTIDYMHFEGRDNLLVQAIEDGLWESLRPVFGRKGSK